MFGNGRPIGGSLDTLLKKQKILLVFVATNSEKIFTEFDQIRHFLKFYLPPGLRVFYNIFSIHFMQRIVLYLLLSERTKNW